MDAYIMNHVYTSSTSFLLHVICNTTGGEVAKIAPTLNSSCYHFYDCDSTSVTKTVCDTYTQEVVP